MRCYQDNEDPNKESDSIAKIEDDLVAIEDCDSRAILTVHAPTGCVILSVAHSL